MTDEYNKQELPPIPVEYVTKTIFQTGKLRLKHQVKLASKNSLTGGRKSAIYVNQYTSSNYGEDQEVLGIHIDTSDYLYFEYRTKEETFTIFFSYPHMLSIQKIFNTATNWFIKHKDLFTIIDNELTITARYNNLTTKTTNTIGNKLLAISPRVVVRRDEAYKGVILNIDNEAYLSLTLNELKAIYYILEGYDLYSSSLMLMNYVLANHPEQYLLSEISMNTLNTKKTTSNNEFFTRVRKKVDKSNISSNNKRKKN